MSRFSIFSAGGARAKLRHLAQLAGLGCDIPHTPGLTRAKNRSRFMTYVSANDQRPGTGGASGETWLGRRGKGCGISDQSRVGHSAHPKRGRWQNCEWGLHLRDTHDRTMTCQSFLRPPGAVPRLMLVLCQSGSSEAAPITSSPPPPLEQPQAGLPCRWPLAFRVPLCLFR